MTRLLLLIGALAIAGIANGRGAAFAQVADGESNRTTIVVEGTRQTREDVQRETREFVRQIGIAQGQTPAARWLDPVCIKVLGIAPEYAALVHNRLTETARSAQVPLAQGDCDGNLAVVFTEDGAGLAREIGSQNPRVTAGVAGPDRDALYNGAAPVRWWYSIAPRGRNGNRPSTVLPPWSASDGPNGNSPIPVNEDTTVSYGHDASFVSTQIYRGIVRATVVVDVHQAEGKSLDAVASYVAMVAFAEIRRNDLAPPGSILGLFALDAPPQTPTARDLQLLREIYRLPLDRTARRHRARLVEGLVDAAMGENPEASLTP